MKAIIKETGQEVEVVSRFMPKKRNAPGRAWVCVLNDERIVDEVSLEYIGKKPEVEICPHSIKSKSYKENGYPIEGCVQEAAKNYADEHLLGNNRELAESGHTRHFKMGYVCFAGYEIEEAFMAGIAYERERATKETSDTVLRSLAKRSGVEVADCRIVRVGDHNAVEVETDEYFSGLERFSDGDKVDLIIVKKEVGK